MVQGGTADTAPAVVSNGKTRTAAGAVLATGILGPAEVEEALRRLGPVPAFLVTILVVADVCAHPACCHLTQLRSRSSANTRRCAMIRP